MPSNITYRPLSLIEPEEALILKEGGDYSFSDYTRSNEPIDDILERFGVGYLLGDFPLPCSKDEVTSLATLFETLQRNLRHAMLDSEAAQREFLLAPVVMEIADIADALVNVEYPLRVTKDLNGRLDYYLKSRSGKLVVIEAKRGVTQLGFVQLTVPTVALSRSGKTDADPLYGAVVAGGNWSFGRLDVASQRFLQGIRSLDSKSDVDDLRTVIQIMVGILSGETLAPG